MTELLSWHGIICTRCARTLPIVDFYRNQRSTTGRQAHCKACQRHALGANQHRRRNRERQRRLRAGRAA